MSSERANVVLLGTGVVGGAFLAMLEGERPPPIALHRAIRRRANVPHDAWFDALVRLPNPVLIDATAADGMEPLYLRALAAGVHVVTANKKPITCPWPLRERLFAAAAGKTRLRYEATVGAGLPVIETLKDLVRTGDRVRRIDCVLSGTLGFVCDELRKGQPLSRIVARARELGYTEPDPRDDLGGADVARKAVILARELGASLELGDVDLEPFITHPPLASAEVADIERALAPLDAEFARRVERLEARGERLVYLARIDRAGDAIRTSAGPVAVRADHPAAALAGTRALVAFTSDRYADQPLFVSGSGAGGAVTAAALAADVLKATQLA